MGAARSLAYCSGLAGKVVAGVGFLSGRGGRFRLLRRTSRMPPVALATTGALQAMASEVDDAKRLVDRGAAEDGAVGVELDGLFLGDHLLDPDDVVAAAGGVAGGEGVAAVFRDQIVARGVSGGVAAGGFLAELFDFGRASRWRSRGVSGAPGAEDDLGAGGQVADGVDEVGDALLAGDAADEEDVGFGGVDAVFCEGLGGFGGVLVLLEVDAVVDDVDAGGVDVGVGLEDVGLGAVGDGDDGVRRRGWRCVPSRRRARSRSLAAQPSRRGAARASGVVRTKGML